MHVDIFALTLLRCPAMLDGMENTLEAGEVVQLHPDVCRNRMFAGCMMTVTEPKPWGAQGYVQVTGQDGKPGGQAYYRAIWEEIVRTGGVAEFIVGID